MLSLLGGCFVHWFLFPPQFLEECGDFVLPIGNSSFFIINMGTGASR